MRVVVNTVLALTASIFSAFSTSAYYHKGKFSMEDVLNATLAGGVAIGSTSDMMIAPWQPLLVGFLGGMLSSVGFNTFNFDFHDSCGVNNLHGLPGILGGLASVVMAAYLDDDAIGSIFPERAGPDGISGGKQAAA